MFVILCDLDDSAALWLDARFRDLGQSCTLVTSGLLSFAQRRSQWMGRDGTRAIVDLGEGGVIDQPDLVVNRLLSPPVAAWQWARPGERDYAAAEITAFALSWLAAVPGAVRNRPTPTCLAGPSPNPLRAAVVAHRAGLPVPDADVEAGTSPLWLLEAGVRGPAPAAGVAHLVVLDGRIVDADAVEHRAGARMPDGFSSAIARFAAAVGAAEGLIGIDIVVAGGRWWFAGMTPLPDLMLAGDALVQDLIGLVEKVPA